MSQKNTSLSRAEAEKILSEEETGVLCLSRDGAPYAVPVSYAYAEGRIILHSKPAGMKLEILRRNPKVCFLVSRHPDRARPHHHPEAGACSFRFESVLCFGAARMVEDPEEKLGELRRFKDYFYRRLGLDPEKDPVSEAAARSTACIVVQIDKITGRKKEPAKG